MHSPEKMFVVADAFATLSKDKSTKVGALILGPSGEIRASGWNGAPRGCDADEDERGDTRPEKYFWFSHAEMNAITNAARAGTPLEGCTLLVTHPPCMDCARAIVQAGIKTVISRDGGVDFLDRWKEHAARTTALFAETGVVFQIFKSQSE